MARRRVGPAFIPEDNLPGAVPLLTANQPPARTDRGTTTLDRDLVRASDTAIVRVLPDGRRASLHGRDAWRSIRAHRTPTDRRAGRTPRALCADAPQRSAGMFARDGTSCPRVPRPPASPPSPPSWLAVAAALLAAFAVVAMTIWSAGRVPAIGLPAQIFAGVLALWCAALGLLRWWPRVGATLGLGALGLAVFPALELLALAGVRPLPLLNATPVGAVFSAGCLLALFGLLRRQLWGWWLACAGAVMGLLSGGLNALDRLPAPSVELWGLTLTFLGAGCALLGLLGPDLRRALREGDHVDPVWRAADPLVAALRWTIGASLLALPMLFVYAWVQPVIPGTAGPAIALAGLLALSLVLVIARKVIGALLLSLAGAALLALLALMAYGAAAHPEPCLSRIVAYYAVFWGPAGLLALRTGALLAARLGRRA